MATKIFSVSPKLRVPGFAAAGTDNTKADVVSLLPGGEGQDEGELTDYLIVSVVTPPTPGPLPKERGNSLAACWQNKAFGFAGR